MKDNIPLGYLVCRPDFSYTGFIFPTVRHPVRTVCYVGKQTSMEFFIFYQIPQQAFCGVPFYLNYC